jgi:hypothetical protein
MIPNGYTPAGLALQGTTALLMNSGEVDRESDEYRAFYALSKKRGKTIEDESRLAELEWVLGLYLDAELGPYIPAKNVAELLRSAATKYRLGEEIKRSLIVLDTRIPLIYDGPRDQEGLWAGKYRYTAMVATAGANRGRVMRCRPCFEGWSLAVNLAFDPEDLDADILGVIVERCQKYGLGDYRPTFGAFTAALSVDAKTRRRVTQASATKTRDRKAEKAAGVRAMAAMR